MSGPTQVKAVPGMETYREKASRKFKENPWVPLGSLATVGALVVAMVKMRRGQSHSFNQWLRVRVAAQGLTIVAIVAGTYSLRPRTENLTASDPTLIGNDADAERRRQEKIAKEHAEFEERLKGAEEAHAQEAELKERLSGKGPTKPGSASEARDTTGPGLTNAGGSWFGWMGWRRSSTPSATPTSSQAHSQDSPTEA